MLCVLLGNSEKNQNILVGFLLLALLIIKRMETNAMNARLKCCVNDWNKILL